MNIINHNQTESSNYGHTLIRLRWPLIFYISLFFVLIGCNSLEGELPTGEEPAYPEFELEKVGELNLELEGRWIELQSTLFHYEGDQPLVFIRAFNHIVAIDIQKNEVRWIQPETIFGDFHYDGRQISFFDRQEQLIVSNGLTWIAMDPETGTINNTVGLRERVNERSIFGYSYAGGKGYVYTRDTYFDSTFVYEFNLSSHEVHLVHSYGRPRMFSSNSTSYFPYDEDQNSLLLPFPLPEEGGKPGAFVPFLNPETNEVDSHYLNASIFENKQVINGDPIRYSNGILTYSSINGFNAYNLNKPDNSWRISSYDQKRERDFILTWDDNQVMAYELQSGRSALPSQYPNEVQLPPLLHPSENIVVLPYRNCIVLVELYTGHLLIEHPIAEADTPYEAIFFDTQGRLCVLGRDQRLEFFELPI